MAPFNNEKDIKEWIAGIYLRVSTFDQAREGHSYEEQEKDLRRLCTNRNFKIYAVYGDPGVSGRKYEQRKHFQQLLDDMRTGKINVVVVWRLDRLVRGVANTQKVIAVAKESGCRIITSWNDLDYNTAAGKYQINMEAAHGEYELDIISERTKLGLAGAFEKLHFNKIPFGYTRDYLGSDRKKMIIDENDAKYVKRIFELYLQGNSMLQVSEIINKEYTGTKIFKECTIEKIIHNETYAGKYHSKKMELETGQECVYTVPPIIDAATWKETQEQYKKNQLHNMRKQTYIFLQKIKCPCCGYDILSGASGKGRNGIIHCYYICTRCKGIGYVKEQELEEAFVKEINEILDYFMIADVGTIPISNKTKNVDNEEQYDLALEELDKRASRIKKAYFDGFMDETEFSQEMKYIQIKQENINNQIKRQVKRDIRITNDMDITLYSTIKEIRKRHSNTYYSEAIDIWNQLDKDQKRIIVADYVDKIEINIDSKRNVKVTNIKFREKKIFNLAFMMKEQLMDMTIKKDEKNILISQTKTKKEIDEFIKSLQKYYKVNVMEVEIDDIKLEKLDSNKVVKIMPIKNTTLYKKQKYTIITI